MQILVDALTISFKFDAVTQIIDVLGIEQILNQTQPRRSKWYDKGFYYPGLNVGYNEDELGRITETLLDLSGQGCRLIETLNPGFDWFGILDLWHDELTNKDAHISRIDLACDCHDEDPLDYDKILHATDRGHYVCLASDVRWICGSELCIYFGSPKSARMLRIYDKAAEQGIDGKWIRLELQLRNDAAMSIWLTHITCPDLTIGQIYTGNLRNFLRFVSVPRGEDIAQIKLAGNTGRLNTVRWWEAFLGGAEALPQLYLPGEEYTLDRLDRYIKQQLSSSLKTYIYADNRIDQRIAQISGMLDTIMQAELNPRQQILLDQLRITRAEYLRRIIAALRQGAQGRE